MQRILILSCLIFFITDLKSQTFRQERRNYFISSISLNGVVGGVGALINKEKEEKPLSVFFKGFWQGSLGGAVSFVGKDLTFQITDKESLVYAWPARFVNSVGNSMIENAVANRNFWERWHLNLYLFRLDYEPLEKRFQARVLPSALVGAVMLGSQGSFNVDKTLASGTLVFENKGLVRSFAGLSNAAGIVTSVALDPDFFQDDYYEWMAHEILHTLQYDNMVWFNPMLTRADQKWKTQSGFYSKASKYVYFDLNGLGLLGFYSLTGNRPWECRPTEREADHYSRRMVWPKCD